jgi:hypothetical protein
VTLFHLSPLRDPAGEGERSSRSFAAEPRTFLAPLCASYDEVRESGSHLYGLISNYVGESDKPKAKW